MAGRDRYAPWHRRLPGGGGARGAFKKKGVHMPRCGKMLTLLILTMSRPTGREGAGVTFVLGTRRSTPSSPGR